MVGIIITAAVIWFISRVASAAFETAKEERRQKQIMRIQAEQFRQEEEIRQARLEARQAMTKQLEYERDQFLLKKEVERIAEEQRKQAERISKNEEKLRKVEYERYAAQEEIEFINNQLEKLMAQYDHIELERDACVHGSSNYYKWDKKLIALDNQIHTANKKLNKAMFLVEEADRKLEVA